MKILFLNVFEGCHDKDRYKKLIRHIQKQSPDILGLNELNNWEKNEFERLNHFLTKTQFPYHVFCKSKSGFNMALFSKYPIKEKIILHTGFRTGAIIADIKTPENLFTVALTHLHYKTETLRIKEIRLLLNNLQNKTNIILMGDLNSLSPHDGYNEKELLSIMHKKGITKFGEKKLQTSVISKILENNFLDTVRHISNKYEYSVPTRVNHDIDHFIKLRLDYIFISQKLRSQLKKAKIVKNNETHMISDHFPLFVEIEE